MSQGKSRFEIEKIVKQGNSQGFIQLLFFSLTTLFLSIKTKKLDELYQK